MHAARSGEGKKKKGDQGGGKKPLVLPKAESERTETRPAGPVAWFLCAFLSTVRVPTFSWGEALSVTAVWLSRQTERSEVSSGCNVNMTAQRDEEQRKEAPCNSIFFLRWTR